MPPPLDIEDPGPYVTIRMAYMGIASICAVSGDNGD